MKIINKMVVLLAVIMLTNNTALPHELKGGKKKKTENVSENKSEKEKKISLSESGEGCFDESTHILNLGIGFGGGNYYSGYSGYGSSYIISPAFSASYEQAFPKKLGPGYLGLGAYLGFQTSNSTYNYFYDNNGYVGNYYYKHSWKDFMIAARGAYHWDILNLKKVELYGGALIGLRIETYSYETNNPDPRAYDYRVSRGSVFPTFSVFVGGRWYFAKNIGLFGELGYGISYVTGGISFKF